MWVHNTCTPAQLKNVRKRHGQKELSESEARAVFASEMLPSTSRVEVGEAAGRARFGLGADANMVDHMRFQKSGSVVPVEVKNQAIPTLRGGGNAAMNKFNAIAESPNFHAAQTPYFELMIRHDAQMPANSRIAAGGWLEEFASGAGWQQTLSGGVPVKIRRVNLGGFE